METELKSLAYIVVIPKLISVSDKKIQMGSFQEAAVFRNVIGSAKGHHVMEIVLLRHRLECEKSRHVDTCLHRYRRTSAKNEECGNSFLFGSKYMNLLILKALQK